MGLGEHSYIVVDPGMNMLTYGHLEVGGYLIDLKRHLQGPYSLR